MPQVLHLIKSSVPAYTLSLIRRQSREPNTILTVVLLHGAAPPPLPTGVRIHRLVDDASTRSSDALTYSQLLDLIFAADQVIAW